MLEHLPDDALLNTRGIIELLGIPASSYFAWRKRLGSNFPAPAMAGPRPRWRVGTLRAWLRRMESANGAVQP